MEQNGLILDDIFKGPYTGVSIDTRTIKPGEFFVAIPGERFDGHDYAHAAEEAGAAAILTEKLIDGLSIPQFVVPDTIKALGEFAIRHRQKLSCAVIALTGSNGKTTVKEMIAQILPPPAFATPGNLNNHIGVPLSVLQLRPEHRYAVLELGASHLGEVAYTVNIARPDVTLINNIAPAHIEGFGSIDGVARAKGEIHQGLRPNGTAVVNEGDDYAHFWDDGLSDCKVLRFSIDQKTPIRAEEVIFNEQGFASFTLVTPFGQETVVLKVPGRHNVSNALAAASCCVALGLSLDVITHGLKQFSGVKGRLNFHQGMNQSVIIDDTYNANLRSVLTALDVLSKRTGIRILVLGDMGELGAWTQQHHREIGERARQCGIDKLLTCGQHSVHSSQAFGEKGRHYQEKSQLLQDLKSYLSPETTVLVKGSRSSAMEKIVNELIG